MLQKHDRCPLLVLDEHLSPGERQPAVLGVGGHPPQRLHDRSGGGSPGAPLPHHRDQGNQATGQRR